MSSTFEPMIVTGEFTQGTKSYTKLCTLEYNPETKVVSLIGGSTGFESFYVPDKNVLQNMFDDARGWLANFGGNGYPQCLISAPQMKAAFLSWGLIS